MMGPIKSGADTLIDGVVQVFPRVGKKRLVHWLEATNSNRRVEEEALLFISLICGVRFGIYYPTVEAVQSDLSEWLTGHPRSMKPELTELVIEALTPGLRKAVATRKEWRVGPSGVLGKRSGRRPTSRSAWVGALVVDRYLRQMGVSVATASDTALELAAILIRRSTGDATELRRTHRQLGKPDVEMLTNALISEFEWWITHDGIRSKDPDPGHGNEAKYSEWRKRHRSLAGVLSLYGTDSLARETLSRLGPAVWGTERGHGQ